MTSEVPLAGRVVQSAWNPMPVIVANPGLCELVWMIAQIDRTRAAQDDGLRLASASCAIPVPFFSDPSSTCR